MGATSPADEDAVRYLALGGDVSGQLPRHHDSEGGGLCRVLQAASDPELVGVVD